MKPYIFILVCEYIGKDGETCKFTIPEQNKGEQVIWACRPKTYEDFAKYLDSPSTNAAFLTPHNLEKFMLEHETRTCFPMCTSPETKLEIIHSTDILGEQPLFQNHRGKPFEETVQFFKMIRLNFQLDNSLIPYVVLKFNEFFLFVSEKSKTYEAMKVTIDTWKYGHDGFQVCTMKNNSVRILIDDVEDR